MQSTSQRIKKFSPEYVLTLGEKKRASGPRRPPPFARNYSQSADGNLRLQAGPLRLLLPERSCALPKKGLLTNQPGAPCRVDPPTPDLSTRTEIAMGISVRINQ
jgi:hypothetical protein